MEILGGTLNCSYYRSRGQCLRPSIRHQGGGGRGNDPVRNTYAFISNRSLQRGDFIQTLNTGSKIGLFLCTRNILDIEKKYYIRKTIILEVILITSHS